MLKIVFKNGNECYYNETQYDDYKYDGKCFIIIKGNQWIGIYNMDNIICITVEPK